MKVLAISGSLRKRSNTAVLVEEALTGAREMGAETETISLIGKNIHPCDGCYGCRKTGKCHIKDDMQDIYPKIMEAQGIIIGSPVLHWCVSGAVKVFIDRTCALGYPRLKLANKVAGMVLVASRTGTMNAAAVLSLYFTRNHMFQTDWVTGLAREVGKMKNDKFAMVEAREMGKQMVKIINKGFVFPEEYYLPLYQWVEAEFGIKSPPFDDRD